MTVGIERGRVAAQTVTAAIRHGEMLADATRWIAVTPSPEASAPVE